MTVSDATADIVVTLADRIVALITWIKRHGHADMCNYYDKFHAKSGYVCDCGLEDLLGYRFDPENEDA